MQMSHSPLKEKDILKIFSSNNQSSIEEILESDNNIRLHTLANSKNFTVLHFTCFNNNFRLTQLVVEYCIKKSQVSQKELLRLINAQNKEGFTALHLASFKGNLEIIKYLLHHGADYTLKSGNGLSVLHMSVQGDHVKISYFWVQRGISVDQTDINNHTPLIWASFLGSIQMINFLIPWGANINHITSDKGQTALHLATQQGQTRIVRKLLIKGIDRQIRDKNNKTALDIACESRFRTIQNMIENKQGILERCGIRQPYQKVGKQYKSVGFFMISSISCIILTLLFTLPYSTNNFTIICFISSSCLMMFLFIYIILSDPSNSINQKQDLMKMFEENNIEQICPDCQIVKPQRSRHCEICQKCIIIYDHHCPWLANCIGGKNIIGFIIFLISLIMVMICEITIQSECYNVDEIEIIAIFKENSEFLEISKKITFYYTMIINCLFIFPILGLVYVQLTNIFKGQTTYERYMERQGLKKAQMRKNSQEAASRVIKVKDNISQGSASTAEDDIQSFSCCGVNRNRQKSKEQIQKPLIKETEFM